MKEGEIIHAVNEELEGEEALYTSVMFPSERSGHETWTERDRTTIEKPGHSYSWKPLEGVMRE